MVARVAGTIRHAATDLWEIARDTLDAFNKLHRKSSSINVGDMVVVRMGDASHRTDAYVGRSGVVVYKNTNPVWARYSVLIDTQRISLGVQEIERC